MTIKTLTLSETFSAQDAEHRARQAVERIARSRPIAALSAAYVIESADLAAQVAGTMTLSDPSSERAAALAVLGSAAPEDEALRRALATVRGVARQHLSRTIGNAVGATAQSDANTDDSDTERAPITTTVVDRAEALAQGAALLRAMHGHVTPKRRGRQCAACRAIGREVIGMMDSAVRWGWTIAAPSERGTVTHSHNDSASAEQVRALAHSGALAADGLASATDRDSARPMLTTQLRVTATTNTALDLASPALETDETARDALRGKLTETAQKTKAERPISERTTENAVRLIRETSLESLLARGLRVHSDFTYEDRAADKMQARAFWSVFVSSDRAPAVFASLSATERRVCAQVSAVFGSFGRGIAWAMDTEVSDDESECSIIRWNEIAEACAMPSGRASGARNIRDAMQSATMKLARWSQRESDQCGRESFASSCAREHFATSGAIAERAERIAEAQSGRAERIAEAMRAQRVAVFGRFAMQSTEAPTMPSAARRFGVRWFLSVGLPERPQRPRPMRAPFWVPLAEVTDSERDEARQRRSLSAR